MTVDLTSIPDEVRRTAILVAKNEREVIVGWKAITEPDPVDPQHRVRVKAYRVFTDGGIYEINSAGDIYMASVMHQMPYSLDDCVQYEDPKADCGGRVFYVGLKVMCEVHANPPF